MPVVDKMKESFLRKSRQVAKESASDSMARAREEWKHLRDEEKEQRRDKMRKVIGDIGAMGP